MAHLKSALRGLLLVIPLALAVGHGGYYLLKIATASSGFRLTIAGNADHWFSGKKVSLIIGDSRMMDGFNATLANAENSDLAVVNLAFNGLEMADSRAMLSSFIRNCDCEVDQVVINAGGLENETPGTSDMEVYAAAFDPSLRAGLFADNRARNLSLRALPLLYFNNEMFLRSLYYLIKNTDDQEHKNHYRLFIPNTLPPGPPKHADINPSELKNLAEFLATADSHLSIVLPPHHPVYTDSRNNYQGYINEVSGLARSVGASFYDHSRLYATSTEFFADRLHLHANGQAAYTRYLATHVLH